MKGAGVLLALLGLALVVWLGATGRLTQVWDVLFKGGTPHG